MSRTETEAHLNAIETSPGRNALRREALSILGRGNLPDSWADTLAHTIAALERGDDFASVRDETVAKLRGGN